MKPSEVLDSAANIIIRDGWHQGAYYKRATGADILFAPPVEGENESAPCCQAGAISRAIWGIAFLRRPKEAPADELEVHKKAMDYACRVVLDLTNGREASAVGWNDEPDRTAEEVTAMLRSAAELARAAEE